MPDRPPHSVYRLGRGPLLAVAALVTASVATPACLSVDELERDGGALAASAAEGPKWMGPRELAPSRFVLASLEPGERAQVYLTTNGSGASVAIYRFDFEATGAGDLVLTEAERRGADDREVVGPMPLSDADVAGLDGLLDWYRVAHPGECTTTDIIGVNRGVLTRASCGRQEMFRDSSCLLDDPPEGVLPLRRLYERARGG